MKDPRRLLYIALGLLLLASAALKIHWLTHTPPQLHVGWLDFPGVIFPASAFELCLGGLLLVGARSPVVRWATVSTFAVFVCVALAEALGGSRSCGCFGGGVHISPWIMAGFDSFCVVLLLRCKAQVRTGGVLFGLGRIRIALVLAMISTGIATAAVWAAHRPPVVVAQLSQVVVGTDPFGTPGSLVLLDSQKWAGKPFLLCSHIDIGSQFRHGQWIILLVHHDCDECAGAVPKYQAASTAAGAARLAIIEMPPYAAPGQSAPWPTSIGLFGKLDTTRDRFATTPLAILAKDGIVQAAADGEHAAIPLCK